MNSERRRTLKNMKKSVSQIIDQSYARLSNIDRELERLDDIPDIEGFPQGTVLRFNKQFPNSPKSYQYVVLKCENDYWYCTSSNTMRMTNDRLIDFLSEGVDLNSIEMANKWVKA